MRQTSSRRLPALLACSAAAMLGGCVVRTAADVAMVPVHATSWTVDKITTSPSEADRNRGREMRKQEEREAKERRREERQQEHDAYSGGD